MNTSQKGFSKAAGLVWLRDEDEHMSIFLHILTNGLFVEFHADIVNS